MYDLYDFTATLLAPSHLVFWVCAHVLADNADRIFVYGNFPGCSTSQDQDE